MANLTAVASQIGLWKTEEAIVKLQYDYTYLETENIVATMTIFEKDTKAKMFCSMKSGTSMDAWIRKQIGLYKSWTISVS